MNSRFWRTAVLVLAVVVLINYLPILAGKIPFPRDLVVRHSAWNGQPQEHLPELIDIVAMFYPFRALLSRAAGEGTVPLWNPHIMSGAPFQANAQSAVFAPLNIVYYILPLKAAWTASLLLHLFLAGFFMALFVGAISPTGAIISGILFGLCGFLTAWQGMSNGNSAIWLPLMFYAVHRLRQRPDSRSVAIAAIAFAMPVLSGHPETAAHSTVAATAFAAFLWIVDRGMRREFAPRFVLAAVLAIGLASVQIIPTIEWMGQLGLQVEAPQPVLDRHQGQGLFSRDITTHPSSAGLWIPEASAYVGMLGLMAASLAFFHPSRRYVYFLLALAIAAAVIAYGVQPFRWIIVHLPFIKAMKNGRLTLVADFCFAALAGLGISAAGPHIRKRGMQFMAAGFVIVSLGIFEVHRATLTPVELSRSPSASLVFLIAAFAVLALRLWGVLNTGAFSLSICALAALEMLSFSYGYTRFAKAADVFPPAPVLEFIRTRDDSAPFRVAKDRVPIPHDAGMIYGFEAADGYDLTTERTRAFTGDFVEKREDGLMFLAENILAVGDRRFDMLNVKYVLVTKPGPEFDLLMASNRFAPVFSQDLVAVFENKTVLPRFLSVPVSGVEVIPDRSAQMSRLKEASFDPEKSVVFSERPGEVEDRAETGALESRVKVMDRGTNGYGLHVDSSGRAVLVVSQMYYPGWRATIDGVEVPVHPVNVALTGIVVPGGMHDVRLFFRPRSFQVGLLISLVSLAVLFPLLRGGAAAPIKRM